MNVIPRLAEITERLEERSRELRADYVARMRAARRDGAARGRLSCSNLAHVMAASGADKPALRASAWPNLGIVTSYNDMLSAHQPFETFPALIRDAARAARATAQVAGGVPAMCDGVTQGQPGMELSLFSRDVIALSTAVSLSHDSFDAALLLGVCDKIVPGLFIGAAAFGHLPILFVPAGPMPPGIPNAQKAEVRQRYAEGKATREELLEAEAGSYHSAGTCTFYGTANSNQMLMELMGLHVPGSAFVPPNTPLRSALVEAAVQQAAQTTALSESRYRPMVDVIDARSIVNAVVGLMATGGSTNHVLHLVAMARAVGYRLRLQDMHDISAITPLLARVYPNGQADVNHFHAAGGIAFLVRELLAGGLLHGDVNTVWGEGLAAYAREPLLIDGQLQWRDAPALSGDTTILRPLSDPFTAEGGLRVLEGNLGEGVIKVSAVKDEHLVVEAPARVFDDQEDFARAFKAGTMNQDLVAVLRFQGPRRQRHAGAAPAHAPARQPAGQGFQGRPGHRRPHVRRLGQGAGGDPCHARRGQRRAVGAGARWRHHPCRCDHRRTAAESRRPRIRRPRTGAVQPVTTPTWRRPGAVRAFPRHRRCRGSGGECVVPGG